ncbi:hypothetical protein VNO78_21326 [Psophocarpus tetragonolobus]|uniref:Secreted protein n=1 Tax=Psophocarpus tetragonolobus TaxID=3891 RepID=A0AAN9SBI5_PSOTE
MAKSTILLVLLLSLQLVHSSLDAFLPSSNCAVMSMLLVFLTYRRPRSTTQRVCALRPPSAVLRRVNPPPHPPTGCVDA